MKIDKRIKKEYLVLVYQGSCNHALLNRNDYDTNRVDKYKMVLDPREKVSELNFKVMTLENKLFDEKQEVAAHANTIKHLRALLNKSVADTVHWTKGCEGNPLYSNRVNSSDISFVTCKACRFKHAKEMDEQRIRMLQGPLL